MIKVAICDSYGGGYSLSDEAFDEICKLKSIENPSRSDLLSYDYRRTDQEVIQVIEKLGSKASRFGSQFKIEEIPKKYDDLNAWRIDEYDGLETLILEEGQMSLEEENKKLKERIVELEKELSEIKHINFENIDLIVRNVLQTIER